MEFFFLAITPHDPLWLALAFVCGFIIHLFGLPPLIGFLLAGFALHTLGVESSSFLLSIADIGITLLLFTIGLKLKLKSLTKPEVWGVSSIHMASMTFIFTLTLLALAYLKVPLFADITTLEAVLIGFALSFSSTVFAIKILETLGGYESHHGRTSIGVLIVQDLAAVIFIAISADKIPSIWSFALLLLIPARHLLQKALDYTGHGELLVLYGVVLALGGADIFEIVGMKEDLGALVFGMLLAGHPKADELSKSLMGFKDVFLVGFFLSIGMTATPGWYELIAAFIIIILLPLKTALYFGLFSLFKLRARPAWQSSLNLANYSEFGLIVGAIAASSGLLPTEWLAVFAIALAISFTLSAPLATNGDGMYRRWKETIKYFERRSRVEGDDDLKAENIEVVVVGMGRLGIPAYDALSKQFPGKVLGIDLDDQNLQSHEELGRFIVIADAANPDLWSRAPGLPQRLQWAVLCLPNHQANIAAAKLLHEFDVKCHIAATTKFPDEEEELREYGVEYVFNIYTEAGKGFANDLHKKFVSTQLITGVPQ